MAKSLLVFRVSFTILDRFHVDVIAEYLKSIDYYFKPINANQPYRPKHPLLNLAGGLM